MEQFSLFGEGEDRLQAPAPTKSDPVVRARKSLDDVLGRLRSAHKMPFTDREARMWSTVVPQMANWLQPDEAEAAKAEFFREMERLQEA